MDLDTWRARGTTEPIAGHPIFWMDSRAEVAARSTSPRPALLVIHGFPTSSWDFWKLWAGLTARFRVVAPDMLGFGFSAKSKGHHYSIFEQADLLEALLARLGVEHFHVLAHDYGDTVAQELLARQSEPGERPRMRGVAFLNGGLFPETHRPLLMQRLLLSPLGPVVTRLITRASLARSLRNIFGPKTQPDDEFIDGAFQLVSHNRGVALVPKLITYMRERRTHRERWVGALQRAAIPLKLIDGAADPISGRHMVERYRELVPKADVTVLEGIGHYPQCEAPGAVLEAFSGWVEAIKP